jgi:hypothetical protein
MMECYGHDYSVGFGALESGDVSSVVTGSRVEEHIS